MVNATETEYMAYMEPVWAEIKCKDRDAQCMVKGKNGKLIRILVQPLAKDIFNC